MNWPLNKKLSTEFVLFIYLQRGRFADSFKILQISSKISYRVWTPLLRYLLIFFPFDFRFDLCVKAKGHKKDLGRKNGRDNITASYTCLVYVVDPVYLRHVLRRLELSIKPGCNKFCVWSHTYSLKPTCVITPYRSTCFELETRKAFLFVHGNKQIFLNVSSAVKADKLWNSAAIFAFLSGMV